MTAPIHHTAGAAKRGHTAVTPCREIRRRHGDRQAQRASAGLASAAVLRLAHRPVDAAVGSVHRGLAFVTGVIAAVAVTRVFRLPPVELSGRVNLWYGLVFVLAFLGAVVRGSLTVAWQVLDSAGSPARRSSPSRCGSTTT